MMINPANSSPDKVSGGVMYATRRLVNYARLCTPAEQCTTWQDIRDRI